MKSLLGVALLAALLPSPSSGQSPGGADAPLELGAPAARMRAGDPISISTGNTPDAALERLAFELDDVDVSGFAQRQLGAMALVLPMQLEPGMHTVRVIELLPDGRILERGVWIVEVRRSDLFQEGTLSGSVDVEVTGRLAEHESPDPPDRMSYRGATNLQGRIGGEDWEVSAYLPVLYDHSLGQLSRGTNEVRDWNLGAFLVQGKKGRFGAQVGEFAPGPPSLILEGFPRRGASASVRLPLRTNLTAWSVRAEPITGFREALGLNDSDRRVSGVTLEGQPIPIPGGVLDLAGTYLNGRSGPAAPFAGTSYNAFRVLESGSAWDVRADGSFFHSLLRVRGEYAQSRYDPFVGVDGSHEKDDAWSVLVGLAPWQSLDLRGYPVQLLGEVEVREIGRLFRSVANPAAPVDRYLREARLSGGWAGLQLGLLLGREEDNTDDLEFLPTFRTDLVDAQLSYSPMFRTASESFWRALLGQPSIQLRWASEDLEPIDIPNAGAVQGARVLAASSTTITDDQANVIASFPGAAFLDPTAGILGTAALVPADAFFDPFVGLPMLVFSDRTFRTTAATIGTSYSRGSWSFSHTVLDFEDHAHERSDTRTLLTGLSGSVYVGRGSVSLSVQRQSETLEAFDNKRTTWLGNLNLQAQIVPQRLDGSFSASITRTRDSAKTTDSRFTVLNSRLDWHAILARTNRPGLTLSLFGIWTDVHDDIFREASLDSWQIFLQATVRWPVQL